MVGLWWGGAVVIAWGLLPFTPGAVFTGALMVAGGFVIYWWLKANARGE